MARILTTVTAFVVYFVVLGAQGQSDICYEKADILFVMDASGSVTSPEFQKQLQFAATFINRFQVGYTQFSVLRFDSTPSIVIRFNQFTDNTALKNALLNIAYTGGGTDTAAALDLARLSAFTSANGARTGVPRIVIVSTDGQSNSPNATAVAAQQLKNSNVLVLSIGVGSAFNVQELNTIASYPEDVFQVIDYNQLLSIVFDYSEMICREVKLFRCSNQADVFFLIDASSRISQAQFQGVQLFITNFTNRFNLADVRVGAATFGGSTVQKLFNLGQFQTSVQISQVMQGAVLLGGETDINNVLKAVTSQNVFDPSVGGRPEAAKVLIVVTEGGSSTTTQAKVTAAQLRATGVNIIAVGVTSPNTNELKDLVNHPVLDVVTNLANPRVLVDRVETITALQECLLPTTSVRDVTDYCKQNNLENGIHPHPYDCHKFIECTFLKTDIMNCSQGLLYDPEIQTCNYPGFVQPCGGIPGILNTVRPVTPSPAPVTAAPCVSGTLDILLILDSSEDVGTQGFRNELGFAANLAENFQLGPSDVQFAAISFGSTIQNLFNFDTYTQYKPLQEAILNALFLGGITNTHLALENAQNVLAAGHGARPGAPNLAIIFTNGRSADSQRTLQQATALKNAGTHVIAVGFSNPNLQELQAITSSPSEAFTNNFDGVLKAISAYSNTVCQGVVVCNGIQLVDVIFVLDSSASISDTDYRSQLTFVADVTNKFILGPDDARFGAVIFSQDTEKLFDLKDFSTSTSLRSAILSARHLKSGTDTAKALDYVREHQMFSINNGGRINATKVVIILTDGRSNSINETDIAAQKLKVTGVKFIAVGIGNQIYEEELRDLASDNESLFLVASYTVLDKIKDSLTRRVCYSSKDPTNVPDYSYLCATYRWADGKHPNPYDCSTYVVCTSSLTRVVSCEPGEAYDPVTQKCADRTSAHSCNDQNYYGPTLPPIINVWTTATTRGPVLVDATNLCNDHQLADGIYPDPTSCNHFIECTALTTQHLACYEGLNFNTANSVCDDVHVVDCQLNYNYFLTG